MATTQPVPVVRLWTAALFGYLALGATLQELPIYVTTRFHTGPLAVGVTVGLAFAGTAAARPFAGRAGDSGRSRAVGIAGGTLTSIAAVGHLLAPNLELLLAARLAMGVGEAALFSGTLPWILSAADQSRGGRNTGWFGLSMWSGLCVGPLLAVCANGLAGAGGVWLLIICLPVVSTLLIASTRRMVRPIALRERQRSKLIPGGVPLPGAILGLAAYGYGTLTALLVLFLGSHGIGGQSFGLITFSLAFLVTRAAGSPLVDRLGGLRVARWVLVIESAGLALLAVSRSEGPALAAVAMTGVGLGIIYPATTRITLTRTPPSTAGAALGAMTSFWDIGILLAGLASGVIAADAGFRPAFWFAVGAALTALALTSVPTRVRDHGTTQQRLSGEP
jgi:MFS family permease